MQGETSCEADDQDAVDASDDQQRVTVRQTQPKAPFASHVGTFAFGDSEKQTKAKCEQNAEHWSVSAQSSSCAPSGPDSTAIRFRFCSIGLCTIEQRSDLSGVSSTMWSSMLHERQRSLEAVYGPPNQEERALPRRCQNTLSACVRDGAAYLRSLWLWDDGQRLELSLDAEAGAPSLRIIHHDPRTPTTITTAP
jgi:hypothetical protein